MKRTTIAFALSLLSACAGPPKETDSVESRIDTKARSMHELVDAMKHDARGIDLANARETTKTATVGGLVQLSENQLRNQHTVFAFFQNQYYPTPCFETEPLPTGGACMRYVACANPPPTEPADSVSVGALKIHATFDQIAIDPVIGEGFAYYPSITRTGPFWRGDGDEIKLSFGGVEGSVPAFEHKVRAPVGDVIARLPTAPISTDVPLRLGWDYADGAQPAEGVLAVQVYGASGGALNCVAPVANRSIELPASLLHQFAPGDGRVEMRSLTTALYSSESMAVSGNVKILTVIMSEVDMGDGGDDDVVNIVFR